MCRFSAVYRPALIIALTLAVAVPSALGQGKSFTARGPFDPADLMATLQDQQRLTDSACQTSLLVTADWPAAAKLHMNPDTLLGGCRRALESLQTLCTTPSGSRAVQSDIKELQCRPAPTAAAIVKNGRMLVDIVP